MATATRVVPMPCRAASFSARACTIWFAAAIASSSTFLRFSCESAAHSWLISVSTAMRLATSPAAAPPMPSQRAKTPSSTQYPKASSLLVRTCPTSVRPAASRFTIFAISQKTSLWDNSRLSFNDTRFSALCAACPFWESPRFSSLPCANFAITLVETMLFRICPLSLLLGFATLGCPANLLAQSANCSVAQPHPLTEEQQAIIRGDLPRAETLYRQKIAQQPKDSELTAGLVRTLLAEQKVDDAESTVKTALAATPQSVELLTALAEVQYREGLPWDEEKTLELAQKVNLCYARLHLVFAKYYLFSSYYATALAKINLAHQLDPY